MIEIIPAILTESDEEFVRQVHLLERAGVRRVHLDIADGVFVPRRTIVGYEQLRRMETSLIFDVHLMVARPQAHCAAWCTIPNAARFLIHVETATDFKTLRQDTYHCGKELGAVMNPETHLRRLEAVVDSVDMVQFMAVHPGAQGRAFVPEVLDRVTEFHTAHPTMPIIVDGGVTPHTAGACVRAGATHLVSGSFVMRSADTSRALRELSDVVS